jgi:rfaE bifunctional protein nucleotidyltransferase chain/domain
MLFIKNTKEEQQLCSSSPIGKRENSSFIDYKNKVNEKPWGKEYLAYQNKNIGIWILHINKDQETSLHCHFKKDTILIPLYGTFKINLYDRYEILNLFESLYIPRNTFHGLHSYINDGIIMEIEVYTENIEYTDKNDLLRIKDIYVRDKNNYESSVNERLPDEDEIMDFNKENKYVIKETEIIIQKTQTLDNLKFKYDKLILLQGSLYSDCKQISCGSFIDLSKEYSFLTENVEILCISNIHYKNLKKIIYSKSHLNDYLQANNLNKIGLTSGCFDILHEGHIKNLKTCKKNCDFLFVCLSSDAQIKRLKGTKRPINNLMDRIKMLINFDFIDIILLYDEINDDMETELDNIMNIIKPDIWFKGNDYTKEDILKKHPSLKSIMLIDFIEGKSTTNIINKIIY